MAGNGEFPATCYLKGEKLSSPEVTWVVSRNYIPEDADGLADVAGRKVCLGCSQVLREAGFVVFNLAKARERRREQARQTIADALAAKGQSLAV